MIDKKIKEKIISEKTLIINKIKYILKINNSLEDRGTLLKGSTTKITMQERGFLNFPEPLLSAGLPLMKNELLALCKSVLIPLGLTATVSATDSAIQKKIYWSGTTALITSNEEMEDIMKIDKSLEESRLIIEGISETSRHEAKKQKGGLVRMLLDTSAASLLRSTVRERGVIRAGEGTIRTGQNI